MAGVVGQCRKFQDSNLKCKDPKSTPNIVDDADYGIHFDDRGPLKHLGKNALMGLQVPRHMSVSREKYLPSIQPDLRLKRYRDPTTEISFCVGRLTEFTWQGRVRVITENQVYNRIFHCNSVSMDWIEMQVPCLSEDYLVKSLLFRMILPTPLNKPYVHFFYGLKFQTDVYSYHADIQMYPIGKVLYHTSEIQMKPLFQIVELLPPNHLTLYMNSE